MPLPGYFEATSEWREIGTADADGTIQNKDENRPLFVSVVALATLTASANTKDLGLGLYKDDSAKITSGQTVCVRTDRDICKGIFEAIG